ncbi:MAG: carbonic anhydrase [Phenylobacterium zucineum]|nr:MAG: carbonic anhydrase [Phenylobacterium zucineum]
MTARLLTRRRIVAGLGLGLIAAPAFAEDGPLGSDAPPVARAKPKPRPKPKAAAKAAPAATPKTAPAPAGPPPVPPEEALTRLMNGNARYVDGYAAHPHADAARRKETGAAERPFATILACSDSRVSPEVIFDQGLGDLAVVRVAGNVVDDAVLASIEHSVLHLGSTLVMVLGHERCGAVQAAADILAGRGDPADRETRFAALASLIAPAIRAIPAGTADPTDAAVSLNASNAAAEIFAGSRPLRARVLAGELKIVAARYDLDDGRVTPTRPQQA